MAKKYMGGNALAILINLFKGAFSLKQDKIIISTTDLEDGVSPLAPGALYGVYEEKVEPIPDTETTE